MNCDLKTEHPLLLVERLSVTYPGRPPKKAVDDVTLSFEANECAAIVGGSGCGKTTLAKTIVGLIKPTAGRIVFDGRDTAEFTPSQRIEYLRSVQLVFQDTLGALNPRMRVGEAVEEALYVHKRGRCPDPATRRARAAEIFDLLELAPDLMRKYPHEISGGQRQRVGIARALALEPRVIIADEPVSALDVAVQAQMLKMLDGLVRKTGLTLILIAHDLVVVRALCSKVYVMGEGRIVESGAPREVFATPDSPVTKSLLDAVPDVKRALERRTNTVV